MVVIRTEPALSLSKESIPQMGARVATGVEDRQIIWDSICRQVNESNQIPPYDPKAPLNIRLNQKQEILKWLDARPVKN